jgi:hypothetical protein
MMFTTRDNRFAVLMFTLTAAGSMTWTVHAKNEPAFSALASTGRHLTAVCEGTEPTCNGLVYICTSGFNCTYDAAKETCGNGEACGDISMTSVCGGTPADDCDGTLGPEEVRITNGTTPNGTNSTNSAFAESRLGPQALLLLSALQLVGWKLLQ